MRFKFYFPTIVNNRLIISPYSLLDMMDRWREQKRDIKIGLGYIYEFNNMRPVGIQSCYEINYFNRPSFYYWNGRTTIPIIETEWRDIKELQYIYLPVEWKPYTFLTRNEKHLLEQGYKLKDIKISYNVIIEGLSSILIVDIMNKMVI